MGASEVSKIDSASLPSGEPAGDGSANNGKSEVPSRVLTETAEFSRLD